MKHVSGEFSDRKFISLKILLEGKPTKRLKNRHKEGFKNEQ
jgi:hypothetical protein